MSIKRETYHSEDTEAAKELKRHLTDWLFEGRIKTNEAAKRLNVTAERMYKYTNEASLINNFPAYMVPLWTKVIGPEMLQYLAHESGYTVVELPRDSPDLLGAADSSATAMKEFAEAVKVFISSVEDGSVSKDELEEIRREVREALSSLQALVVVAEGMRNGNGKR